MPSVHYCEECRKNIEVHGPLVYEAYQYICEYYVEIGRPITIHEKHVQLNGIINFLEKNKYVVSTECGSNSLAILASGINITDDGLVICPDYTHVRERFERKP